MSRTLKSKSILTVLLAVVMAACLAMGFTFTKRDVKAAETSSTQWQFSNPQKPLVQIGESGIMYGANAGGVIINNYNILEAPNKTVTFQLFISNAGRWTGLALLNGKDDWVGTNHIGGRAPGDKYPHMILDLPNRQFHPANSGRPLEGINYMPDTLADQFHTFEIHIGTGKDGDISYMKVDDKQLGHQADAEASLWDFVTVDSFANGCYFVIATGDVASCTMMMGEYNAPYLDYNTISAALKSRVRINPSSAPDNLEFTIKNITGTPALTLNATTDGATYKTINVDSSLFTVADVQGGKKYTLKQSFWLNYFDNLSSLSSLTVTGENGKASLAIPVQKTNPPTVTKDYVAFDGEIKDISFTFDYEVEGLTQGTLKAGRAQLESAPLMSGTDYELTSSGVNYTLTIKKEYLEKKLNDGFNGLRFSFNIDDNTMEFMTYRFVDAEGWYAKATDLAEGETMRTEGFYNVAMVRKFSENTLSTRVYYNKAFDVTKPITFEFKNFTNDIVNQVATGTEWGMLGLMDNLTVSEYFSNDNCRDTLKIGTLFFGGRSDIQPFTGLELLSEGTNANYDTLVDVKNNVVEIMIGDGADNRGYFKVNGKIIAYPTVKQSDFRDGKAYIGFFIADQRRASFEFKANKDVNSIAVTGPNSDISYYTIDISNPANDLVLDVINTDGSNLKVSNDKGLVATADDFSYADGKLTVKKSFFKKTEFAKNGVLYIEDTAKKTGTAINLVYESSAMKAPVVAFATKGALQDAEFSLSGVTGISKIFAGDAELTADKYEFANGKLTIKKSALTDEIGINEFIVISSANEQYPAYVVVNAFKDGFAKEGNGTAQTGNGAYMFTGENGITYMNAYDLTKSHTFKIDFKSTAGYYQSRNNQGKKGYVKFNFYDPYTGDTFYYTLYTNFDKDSVTTTDTALYDEYGFANDGMSAKARAINIANSENANALGVHNVTIAVIDGKINITVDNSRTVKLDVAAQFNVNALVLKVETPDNGDSEMKVAVKEYAEGATVDYKEISLDKDNDGESGDSGNSGNSGESGKTDDNKSGCAGCGGSIAEVGIVGLTLVALCGVTLFRRKKND